MTSEIASRAFSQAFLRTERLRLVGSIFIISVFCVTGGIRIYRFGCHMKHTGGLYCAVGLVGYELLVFRAVRRSINSGFAIPGWFWTINIIIEMFIPALGLAFVASDRLVPDGRRLASSWILLFFPFLILSILRLRAVVSGLASIAGALAYLLAAGYTGWHIKTDQQSNPVTHSTVPFFAVMICAALVAREVRTHAQAALCEAETESVRKQMEHDLTTACSIQQSPLPKVRSCIRGFEIAGWNRSADATGGGYFDRKQLEDGSVTGPGIGPALLASVCRAYRASQL